VRDPSRELDGETVGKLMLWQIAGAGVVAAKAWALMTYDASGVPTLTESAEAWDANGAVVPTVVDVGVGEVRLEYASTYPDQNGTAVTTNFSGAVPSVLRIGAGTLVPQAEVNANGKHIDIEIRNLSDALTDPADTQQLLIVVW
jgi:hypothetical protein